MKVAVILNGISPRKKLFYSKILPELQAVADVEVFETLTLRDAIPLASRAVRKLFDVILAAGGDGTLNQTVNGVLRDNESSPKLPVIGVIPLGTGNDFAKSINVSSDPKEVAGKLKQPNSLPIDVGSITYEKDGEKRVSYFINIADVGMGPEVIRIMNDSDRLFGFSATYYLAILKNFLTYKPIHIRVQTDKEEIESNIRTFAIANGKYFGHGLCIAPEALLDDAMFHTFNVGDVSVFDFIRYTSTLKGGRKINHPKVAYGTAKSIQISCETPALIEADGELVGNLPATIGLLEKRIQFLT